MSLFLLRQLLQDCGVGVLQTSDGVTDPIVSQHRVLLFCQFKSMLDIIEKDLFKYGTFYNLRILSKFISKGSLECDIMLLSHGEKLSYRVFFILLSPGCTSQKRVTCSKYVAGLLLCSYQADIRMRSHCLLRLDDNKSAASCQQA